MAPFALPLPSGEKFKARSWGRGGGGAPRLTHSAPGALPRHREGPGPRTAPGS